MHKLITMLDFGKYRVLDTYDECFSADETDASSVHRAYDCISVNLMS